MAHKRPYPTDEFLIRWLKLLGYILGISLWLLAFLAVIITVIERW